MAARMRIALLAVIGSMGLVSLAYGAGGMVGGDSSTAGGSPNGADAGPLPAVPLVDAGARPHRGPCRHGYGSHGSHAPGSDSSTAAPSADSY